MKRVGQEIKSRFGFRRWAKVSQRSYGQAVSGGVRARPERMGEKGKRDGPELVGARISYGGDPNASYRRDM
jgi:hypothetical protein